MLLVACADGDAALSRAEVEELDRVEIADTPPPETGLSESEVDRIVEAAIADIDEPHPGLTLKEIEAAVRKAIAAVPQTETGLSREEVEEAVKTAIADIPELRASLAVPEAEPTALGEVASIPPKWAPTDYTKYFVQNAISQYETHGIEAVLAYYNSTQSIDGQWYVFIIDENDLVIGDPDPGRVGLDVKGPAGTDVNGYDFGPELLSATEDGKWVSYVYRNPERGDVASGDFGELELKNVWVVRHDGLLFASGWYIGADEFSRRLVTIALSEFRSGGLEATLAYFAEPESALAGLDAAIAYYNQAETVDGKWSAFIADANGKVVAHSNPALIGNDLRQLYGAGANAATAGGNWVITDAVRMWVAEADGFIFGSGWHHDESGG